MVANRANTSFTLVGNEAGSLMSGEPFDNNRAKINECTMKPPHCLSLLCRWPERPAIATLSTPTQYNPPVLKRDVLVPFASMPIGGVCMVTAGRHRS
jgi:hypothetical protein